ncbi:MAG: hypothetical protein ACOCXJ_01540 [Planctomycetota bacterium]
MRHLQSGGHELDPREAARFHVPSFAQRQAEARELLERRQAERERAVQRRREQQQPGRIGAADEPGSEPPPIGGIPSMPALVDQVGTAPRSALGRARQTGGWRDSADSWLERRDAERLQARDAVRERLAPLEEVRGAASRMRSGLGTERLDELDRRLAAEDSSYERGSIQRDLAEPLGKADSVLGTVERVAGAPGRAGDRLDQSWLQRRERIEGAMDRVGPYVDRRERRLSVDHGGSGDVFTRMQRNRERGLERLRERRAEERRDERRRQRARERKREREAEER